MLSGLLTSPKAIATNIAIIRAIIALRQYVLSFAELEQQIAELESKFERELTDVHEVLRFLAEENQTRADEIGSLREEETPEVDWDNRPRIGFKNG